MACKLGFHDFAGSCAIHMVGGMTAFIGAAMVGARIGKFTRNKRGKVTKVHAFPGHNMVIGSLGCFILWFGWYGFNGAAATTGYSWLQFLWPLRSHRRLQLWYV